MSRHLDDFRAPDAEIGFQAYEPRKTKLKLHDLEMGLGQQGGGNEKALRAKECLEGSQKFFWETLKAL